tara:strand:+ start:8515 stop:8727 length:213 start_codon:yes stop_codon:yes gene_type:complete
MKIEKNIPMPSKSHRNSKYQFIVDMEVGDSVLVKSKSTAMCLVTRAKYIRPEWRLSIRTMPDGVRVWRIQ